MDVESNNIANVNTTGYKYSRANFSDLLAQTSSHLIDEWLVHLTRNFFVIIAYCEKDTIAVAQIFLRLRDDELLHDTEIIHI